MSQPIGWTNPLRPRLGQPLLNHQVGPGSIPKHRAAAAKPYFLKRECLSPLQIAGSRGMGATARSVLSLLGLNIEQTLFPNTRVPLIKY